jgi:hypothetical protein
MMNARRITLILGLVLALLIFTIPATGEPEQSVIVDGADVIISTSISSEQGLLDAVGIAGPRVVVEFSNHVRRMSLVVAPDLLPSLEQMSERVSVEFANAILRESLAAVPTGFQAVLDQVPERVVFEFANANLSYSLSYPRELVNDTTPPQIIEIGIGQIEANGILTITWTTDEFADSTVLYGTTSGSYPYTVTDPLHVKLHAVGLPDLVPGTTYYYRLRSTDLSDNTTTTDERSLVALRNQFIYLPVVVRDYP